ncbi:MAG: rhomboid family intramembrane serine protease [Proteobacteria bacterium]|nr:rhomboid family intramembrane serine protease [Pseudomonadota bacterium]
MVFDLLPWNADSPTVAANLLTSLFVHADILHVLMNMLFFYCFSMPVEAIMGSTRYALFYGVCGTVAALVHCLSEPDSFIPLVGASGAVAGVLAAHSVLLPWARLRLRLIVGGPDTVPAWGFTALWFGYQFLTPLSGNAGHVAWLAHVGGVVAGLMLTPLFCRPETMLFATTEGTPERLKYGPGRRLPVAVRAGAALLFSVAVGGAAYGVRANADGHVRALAGEWIAIARLTGIGAPYRPEAGLARYREAAALDGDVAERLGRRLQDGRGVRADEAEAVEWFRRGAAAGQPAATQAYAMALIDGNTVPADPARGMALLAELSAKGHAGADVQLGIVIEEGRGGREADPPQAATLYKKVCEAATRESAAEAAKPSGCYRLALLLLSGRGVPKDPELGRKLLKRAANSHLPEAENAFGLLLATGDAQAPDIGPEPRRQDARARTWFAAAAQAGNADAMYNLARFDSRRPGPKSMSPAEIRRWYEKSAAAGNAKAAEALRQLNQP